MSINRGISKEDAVYIQWNIKKESVRSDPRGHDGPPLHSLQRQKVPNRRILPDPGDQWQHSSPVAMTSRPSSPVLAGEVSKEGSLPDPGDQWQHTPPAKAAPPKAAPPQLHKPPRPSHIEKPISSRHRKPATYPNPHPLAQPSLTACIYKQTSNTVRAHRFPRPTPYRSGNPARERFTIKACKTFFWCIWSSFT